MLPRQPVYRSTLNRPTMLQANGPVAIRLSIAFFQELSAKQRGKNLSIRYRYAYCNGPNRFHREESTSMWMIKRSRYHSRSPIGPSKKEIAQVMNSLR